jgi:NAD(P)-dependent dehydrogenase (short-subunit alcohol dehydrogenase family)
VSVSDQSLAGRVIVLTGASSGIGARIAPALTNAGARTVIAARRLDRLEAVARELKDCIPVECDVTDDADRRRLIETAINHFGQIDGLVNNAGYSVVKPAMVEPIEDFRRVIELNLIAPFALAQLAGRAMKEKGGAIVNVASIAGLRSTRLPTAGYVASKAGLIGLTRELAVQWARYNIRVNAVAPGWFNTELTGPLFESDQPAEWIVTSTPLGRAGAAGELDGAVTFLLSEESSYVTGHTLVVDGGLTAA